MQKTLSSSKTKSKPTKHLNLLWVGFAFIIFAAVCLIVGAFVDKSLSQALAGKTYKPDRWNHSFGNYFSFIPGTLCSIFIAFLASAVILSQPYQFKARGGKIAYYIIAYGLLGFCVWYQCFDGGVREIYYALGHDHTFDINDDRMCILYTTLMCIGFMVPSSLIIIFKCKKYRSDMFKWAILGIMVVALAWLIMVLMKNNLSRIRYRFITDGTPINNPRQTFKPWYSLLWLQSEGAGFTFASFPSGHTMWATTLLLILPLLSLVFKHKTWLQIITISFIGMIMILTMFARIQAAYHYLSDTAASILLFGTTFTACYFVMYKFDWHKKHE
ncbi:MAG: phosphatase PAP2 family protein [Mycoplasmataceae bacterium]|nr:phosphatase PAP2 family protein [Mycoplasmataceae bacterium]